MDSFRLLVLLLASFLLTSCSRDFGAKKPAVDAEAEPGDATADDAGPDATAKPDAGARPDPDGAANQPDADAGPDDATTRDSQVPADARALPDAVVEDAHTPDAEAGVVNPGSCPANHGCPAHHPCVPNAAGFTCLGQRADWPIPLRKAGDPPATQGYELRTATLIDSVTGLMWERYETGVPRTLAQARTYCDGLALDGFSDFRVPSVIEMSTWLASVLAPALDGAILGEHWSGQHWTNTVDRDDPTQQWKLYLGDGTLWTNDAASTDVLVRCVRTHAAHFVGSNATRYSALNANAVTQDRSTGLSWQGTLQPAQQELTFTAADAHCAQLTLDGSSDWRLPTIVELLTTFDFTQQGSMLVTPLLGPIGSGDCYWSSTRSAYHTTLDHRFLVSAQGGAANSYDTALADALCAVRCARK